MPLSLCLVCACSGWQAVLTALGGFIGYALFWNPFLPLGAAWLGAGLLLSLLFAGFRLQKRVPLLLPAVASLVVAICVLLFQPHFGSIHSFAIFLLQTALGFGGTWLFSLVLQHRNPLLDWLAGGLGVLALAQIVVLRYVGLGYIAAGMLATGGAFPAAALGGLALDLAQITPVPMTAVLALSYLIRFLPRHTPWLGRLAPALAYIGVLQLCGARDWIPLPGLLLGGIAGTFLPVPGKSKPHRGPTGVAQVHLEVAAGVLTQARQLLLELPKSPVDTDALVLRAALRACGSCSYRKNCPDRTQLGQLPGELLYEPLRQADDLPRSCRKNGRFLGELRRAQEELRSIQDDRHRQQEYRSALLQQYQFLADFLQDLSDRLTRRPESYTPVFTPQVWIFGNRPEADNGDRCLRFSGTGRKYYVLLCDGMGTGLGAVQDSRTAGTMLRRLLTAGYPAEHALRSLNSLCALGERAGAVTIDMAEIATDSGKAVLYKWGAASSYLVSSSGALRIGAPGPPPGLGVELFQATSHRVTLRKQHQLVLVSDGIESDRALQCCTAYRKEPPEILAEKLLEETHRKDSDDATVVLIRLSDNR